jgi:hypothetical protein
MYMVPGWDHGEVKRDDTMVNESQKMVNNTVEDQNMPEEKVITVSGVGLGRDTFDHPGKTTVSGVTKQHDGECDPDPKEEPENPVPEPVHVPELVPPYDTPVEGNVNEECLAMNVACKYYPDEGGGHEGDHAGRFDNDEVPNVVCAAHKVHHDDGEDNHKLVGEDIYDVQTDHVPELTHNNHDVSSLMIPTSLMLSSNQM